MTTKSAVMGGMAALAIGIAMFNIVLVCTHKPPVDAPAIKIDSGLKADDFKQPLAEIETMYISSAVDDGPVCMVERGNYTTYHSPDGKHYNAWPTPPPDAKAGSCCKLVVVPCEERRKP